VDPECGGECGKKKYKDENAALKDLEGNRTWGEMSETSVPYAGVALSILKSPQGRCQNLRTADRNRILR